MLRLAWVLVLLTVPGASAMDVTWHLTGAMWGAVHPEGDEAEPPRLGFSRECTMRSGAGSFTGDFTISPLAEQDGQKMAWRGDHSFGHDMRFGDQIRFTLPLVDGQIPLGTESLQATIHRGDYRMSTLDLSGATGIFASGQMDLDPRAMETAMIGGQTVYLAELTMAVQEPMVDENEALILELIIGDGCTQRRWEMHASQEAWPRIESQIHDVASLGASRIIRGEEGVQAWIDVHTWEGAAGFSLEQATIHVQGPGATWQARDATIWDQAYHHALSGFSIGLDFDALQDGDYVVNVTGHGPEGDVWFAEEALRWTMRNGQVSAGCALESSPRSSDAVMVCSGVEPIAETAPSPMAWLALALGLALCRRT